MTSKTHYASGFSEGEGDQLLSGMVILNSTFNEVVSINCGFVPHTVIQHPHHPQRFVALDKLSGKACFLDLATSTSPTFFPPSEGCHFYGHGQFTEDGEFFLNTESAPGRFGKIVVRRASDLQIVREIKIPNYAPHECLLLPGSNSLVVAMSGKAIHDPRNPLELPSQVLTIDTISGVVQAAQALGNSTEKFGHLALSKNGDLAATLTTESGVSQGSALMAFARAGERMEAIPLAILPDSRFSHEALSIAFDDARERIISTNPAGETVSMWDVKLKQLLAILELPQPGGVCVNAQGEYVVTSALGSIHIIDPESFASKTESCQAHRQFGSHLTMITPIPV